MSTSLSFDIQNAIDYGIDEAVMIQNFVFWLRKNLANKKHQHDGRTWTYNTQEAFTFLFPFWNKKQVWRILNSLVKQGVIIKGNYNHHAYDRTSWYAFQDEEKFLGSSTKDHQTLAKTNIPKTEFANSERVNQQILKTELANSENVLTIPDTKTDTKTDNDNNLDQVPNDNQAAVIDADVSLLSLDKSQKELATKKLLALSPDQRKIAIDSFNKTVASGNVESTPMKLFNGLIRLGLKNALEPSKAPEPMSTTSQVQTMPRKPQITPEQHNNTRLEVIKAFIANKKTEFLAEFNRNRFVDIRGVGIVIESDLRLAGLFD